MIIDDTQGATVGPTGVGPRSTPIEGVRQTLNSSQDPRVARTRAAIVAAVHRVLAANPESIAVTDVIRESGVSRSSFYSHFASIDELAMYLLGEEYSRIAALDRDLRQTHSVSDLEAMRRSQERLVDHYTENRALYAAALALSTETDRRAATEMAIPILANIRALSGVPADIQPEIAALYVANAAVGLLHAWLRGEVEATKTQLVNHLVSLLPVWLSKSDQHDSGANPPD